MNKLLYPPMLDVCVEKPPEEMVEKLWQRASNNPIPPNFNTITSNSVKLK